jgi:hypothetical protein
MAADLPENYEGKFRCPSSFIKDVAVEMGYDT